MNLIDNLLRDYQPPKCEHCKHPMLGGFTKVRVCRDCMKSGAATDPAYCAVCKGTGAVSTGIEKSPSRVCLACNGAGIPTVKLPAIFRAGETLALLREATALLEKIGGQQGHGAAYSARDLYPDLFARLDSALSE